MDWFKYKKPNKEEVIMLIFGSIAVLAVWYILGLISKPGKLSEPGPARDPDLEQHGDRRGQPGPRPRDGDAGV